MGVLFSQWVDNKRSTTCLHELTVCSYSDKAQNNWMVTQYINISKTGVTELVLNVSYYSSERCRICSELLEIRTFETSYPDEEGRSIPNSYLENQTVQLHIQQGADEQLTSQAIPISGSSTGLYLAVVDLPPGACLTITRLVLFYYVCPEQELNLVIYPEVIAPTSMHANSIQVSVACLENAVFASQTQSVECKFQGRWDSNNVSCECAEGYLFETNAPASSKGMLGVQITFNLTQCVAISRVFIKLIMIPWIMNKISN